MLPDYKESYYVPVRFRHVHAITIVATVATGVPTLVTAESAPRTSIARTSAGLYTVTMDNGQVLNFLGGVSEKTTAPANTDGTVYSCGLVNAALGTATIFVQRPDTGAAADPPDGKLRLRFELSQA